MKQKLTTACIVLFGLGFSFNTCAAQPQPIRDALRKCCPVTIHTTRTMWIQGSANLYTDFDGCRYYFTSSQNKATFDRSPELFVPAFNGMCISCDTGPGSTLQLGKIEFAHWHTDGRIYLFRNNNKRVAFVANSASYDRVDLAFDGYCPVALRQGQQVPGSRSYTVIRHGVRYWCSSQEMKGRFKRDPGPYLDPNFNYLLDPRNRPI